MSDNDLYVKFILASLFVGGLYFTFRFAYRHLVFGRRALSFDWPPGLNSEQAARYAAYYLRWNGWTLSDDIRPAAKILVRATKDGYNLNLFIPNVGALPIQTQMQDAGLAVRGIGAKVTFLTYGLSPDDLAGISTPEGVLILEPRQLGDAEMLLRGDLARKKQDRVEAKTEPELQTNAPQQTALGDGSGKRDKPTSAAEAPERQFDVIASLGAWRAPAVAIQRYFGIHEAYPFDFWQCPYYPTLKLLEERFENVLKLENLEILPATGSRRSTVRCNHYGILHHDDFQRDAEGNVVADLGPQLEAARDKAQAAIDRFLNGLAGKDVLFVRASLNGHLWFKDDGLPFEVPSRDEQVERAITLHAAVRKCTRPRSIDIVVVSNLPSNTILPVEGGRVIFEELGDTTGKTGFFLENYAAVFERLQVSVKT